MPPPAPPTTRGSLKHPQLVWGCVAVISLAGLIGTYMLFVEPPPPRHLVIATGSADGSYHEFAQKYAALLLKEGFTLEVRATQGSVENLRLLLDHQSDIGAALVQSGLADAKAARALQTLGSLYREPLWIFYRGSGKIDHLSQLAGKRIAVGPPGSGSHAVAVTLLEANGVTAKEATFTDQSGSTAVDALNSGTLDAAFLVAAIETPFIRALLVDDNVQIVSLSQQGAYLRRFRFLARAELPAGLIDLGKNVLQNVALVAPTAMLVVRRDLHPALATLLLTTASKIHAGGDLVSSPGEFPSAAYIDLPLSDEAKRYYQ